MDRSEAENFLAGIMLYSMNFFWIVQHQRIEPAERERPQSSRQVLLGQDPLTLVLRSRCCAKKRESKA